MRFTALLLAIFPALAQAPAVLSPAMLNGLQWRSIGPAATGGRIADLAVSQVPGKPDELYVATTSGGIFKSVNGGTNRVAVNTGLGALAINALALDPSAPDSIYAGTTNGLFKSSDGGGSWSVVTNGINSTNIAALAIDPSSPSTVYAGAGTTNSRTGVNCFVTEISSDGASLVYSTVLGGSGHDEGWDIAVDGAGNAYVVGATTSTNFPVAQAPSPMQTTNSGASDAFVLELNPDGSSLAYSFYFGGNANDLGHGIALDAAGNAYIAGRTTSTNFPTADPLQPAFAGGPSDAFVAKVLAQPVLQIARSGNNLLLSWPAPTPEFVLEANSNGMQAADWFPVPQAPMMVNGMNTVTLNISSGHQSFRLKRR